MRDCYLNVLAITNMATVQLFKFTATTFRSTTGNHKKFHNEIKTNYELLSCNDCSDTQTEKCKDITRSKSLLLSTEVLNCPT